MVTEKNVRLLLQAEPQCRHAGKLITLVNLTNKPMQKTLRNSLCTLAVLAVTGSGCKLFIPAHHNSNYREGERVSIRLIDYDAASATNSFGAEFRSNYFAAFNEYPGDHPEPKFLLPAAPIAAAAAGFVLDYVSKSLAEEAKLYQAQFGDSIADSRFFHLVSGQRQFNYYGLVVTRDLVDSDGHLENAYTLVCGICPTADARLMTMKPLIFTTPKAKVKVVGNGPCSYLAVYPWLFKKPGDQINSTVDFKIDGYFRDKDQLMKVIPMGAFSFKFPGYSLGSHHKLRAASADAVTKIPDQASGFLDSAPQSIDQDGKAVVADFTGAFTLKATVTETDTSNAQENLEKLGELVSGQKNTVIKFITNSLPQ